MPVIENSSEIPEVSDDFHLLRIQDIELVEGFKYGEPDVPETRVKMLLRVETPGEETVEFNAWMSTNLGDKATLGSIYRAVIGDKPPRGGVDTDVLVGRCFRHMITHNETGWPKLVSGTAAAVKAGKGKKAAVIPVAEEEEEGAEPPF